MSNRAMFVMRGCLWGLALIVVVTLLGCAQSAPSSGLTPSAVAAVPPPPPPDADIVLAPPVTAAAEGEADSVSRESPPISGDNPAVTTAEKQSEAPAGISDQIVGDSATQDVQQVALQDADSKPAAIGPAARLPSPFPRRFETPEFSNRITWLNTGPLTKRDLKGKFVLFDFWTYCCINCMHILPELKKLEREFPNNLVVIGVHSAKFETEKVTDNIREAILRYEIEHPVINDADHSFWDTYGVTSWPTIILIDPEGMAVWGRPGEFKADEVRKILSDALPFYREQRLLDEKPLKLALEAAKEPATPLRFPGKILADEKSNRLFISDSNDNRIVIATLEGKWLETIGSGEIGTADGDFQTATFNHPQGCALNGETLYVADTENHMLRKVDLKAKTVTTIAGTGQQASNPWPGLIPGVKPARKRFVGPPATTELNSPWALSIHQKELFIAMAGCHQIWKMPLDESEIGPHAGNALEDIVDGFLLPREPFQGGGAASFAQPSGLSSDGTWLYVADSEGSSIRKVPFKHGTIDVGTVVGSDHLAKGHRLFAFGDIDGPRTVAKLQHCLDVDYVEGKIYVADTYNHKIKVVTKTGDTKTLAGTGRPGSGDSPAEFHEPGGLTHAHGKLYVADTNNHLIRTIDLATGKVATLTIQGLAAPTAKQGLAGAAGAR